MGRWIPDDLPLESAVAGTIYTRIHQASRLSTEPFFGPAPGRAADSRFHAPNSEYRVCFVGVDRRASFVEVFLRRPPVRLVTIGELQTRLVTRFRIGRELRLVPLYGPGLARLGCTAEIISCTDHAEPQALSHAIWSHPLRPDGIKYTCRHDNSVYAVALFHRMAGWLEMLDSESLLDDRAFLLDASRRYGFRLA